jgi:hypothetical protein
MSAATIARLKITRLQVSVIEMRRVDGNDARPDQHRRHREHAASRFSARRERQPSRLCHPQPGVRDRRHAGTHRSRRHARQSITDHPASSSPLNPCATSLPRCSRAAPLRYRETP